jgi:4-amino-4-deoxy-L-arabinose transferase-like glycosyltransferase
VAAGIFLALDPLLIAHAQLVHTDSLLSGLTCAAVLSGLIRWGRAGSPWWVVAGGVLSGLAFLTKVPAVALGVVIPLLALGLGWRRGWRALATGLGLWAGAGLLTVVALWPSLWVNPVSTITRMVDFTRETAGQPDEVGSFFLGQAWGDPGPLFYPVALAFRLTPLATIGLLLLARLAWPMRRLLRERWRLVLGLVGYALVFLVLVTVAEKKFDRYALPIVPVLQILAGLGWWLLYRRLRPFVAVGSPRTTAVVAIMLLGLAQLEAPASVYPYYMAYFNPLLGGGPVAARTVMVGNGEGIDQAARYFNGLANVEHLWVAAHSFDLLEATCRCDGEPLRERLPGGADYIVVYGRRIQLQRWGGGLGQWFGSHEPIQRIWINGIEMVRIYPGPHLGQAAGG